MKIFLLILAGNLSFSTGFSQNTITDSTVIPFVNYVYHDSALGYPDCIIPPPQIIIDPWPFPQEWIWSIPYEITFFLPQRTSENYTASFGYCESQNLCFEVNQVNNHIQFHLLTKCSLTAQLEILTLENGKVDKSFYPITSIPIQLDVGYFCFHQKFNYLPDATYLLKIKVDGEQLNARIHTTSEKDLWKIDSTGIYKMNLLN